MAEMEAAATPMAEREVGRAISILRVVRGWSQDDLARASGVRPSAISDYERCRKLPGLAILRRLLEAMGFPLAAIDYTRLYIEALTAGSFALAPFVASPGAQAPPFSRIGQEAVSWEIDQAAAECGRAATRFARIALYQLGGKTRNHSEEDHEKSPDSEPQGTDRRADGKASGQSPEGPRRTPGSLAR
jgi:transcriptional regulator with XRE-family HTH domain